jgi:hypothetical protein
MGSKVQVLDSITQIEHPDDAVLGLAGTRDAWHEGPAMVTVTPTLTWVYARNQFSGIGWVRLA